LVLCGSGLLERALRAKANRLAVDVRFVGPLAPAALVGALNAATCVVHTSSVETFGLSVAEAMACGRPVLGVASGSLPELIGDAGVMAPPENPVAFACLLAELLDDEPRQIVLGAAARQRVLERFRLERMLSAYVHLVESAA
jgi:glycosyltransferase involved in cell wall biosynthesis